MSLRSKVRKAFKDKTWQMKPSETEVIDIVTIVKHHSSDECRFEVERFEKYMKLLSDPSLVRGSAYLTLL